MCLRFEKHVEEHGGEVQLGWQIRQWPGVLFEALFHAVWRDPSGQLQDITPSPDKPIKTLFLPDARTKYEGRQMNSFREPINNSPGGRLMIEARNEEFELMNSGERAFQQGIVKLKGDELREMSGIQAKMKRASQMLAASASAPRSPHAKDDVVPEIGLHDVAHLVDAQGERRLIECRHHLTSSKEPEISSATFRRTV